MSSFERNALGRVFVMAIPCSLLLVGFGYFSSAFFG